MKKLTCLLMTVVMALTMTFGVTTDPVMAGSNTVKHLSVSLKSNMTSVSVKWKKKKNIKKYVIYRTDVTKDVLDPDKDYTYKMSKYKKIGTVSGRKKSFTDKKAKKNHYYAYVVKAYKKVKGKYKLAYTSYKKDYYDYSCRGLGIPELLNGGTGEDYSNSISRIYLYHQSYSGTDPTSVILYRKAKGESEYKKVKFTTVEKIRNQAGMIKDTTVKPGKIYYYKIQTKKNYKGKSYYSKKSKTLRIPVVNVTGRFDVTAIPVSGDLNEIIVKFTSDKYNGTLTLSQPETSEGEEDDIRALSYSYDNVIWESMTDNKAVLKPGKTIYIKFSGNGVAEENEFSFGEDCDDSLVSVSYDNPLFRPYVLYVDLAKNTAEAYPFYD